MAADKTGALIIVERDIGLRTFIESGVRLDAHLSSDLLLAIFYPGAALHDGAVIVQKTRSPPPPAFCRWPSIPQWPPVSAPATAPPSASPKRPTVSP